jgi:hypothetical protein
MPNVNLLPTITTATDNKSYFVVSDNGLVRRFKLENLVTQLQQSIPDANRTDQYLFTTTDVTFRSVNLFDQAGNIGSNELAHGFQASAFHEDGTALKRTDFLGSLRFGGFDGKFNTLEAHGLSTAGISAIAIEDWENDTTSTTRAGSMMSFYIQPVKTQLSDSSRSTFLSAVTTSTSDAFRPVTQVRIGSVLPTTLAPNYITTSYNGVYTYTSAARSDVIFSASRLFQAGVPNEDPTPINSTVTGTNIYTFVSSRRSNFIGALRPIKDGDSLGVINFRGISTSTDQAGLLGATIRAHATSDFDSAIPGAGLHFRTLSSSTGQLYTTLELQPEGNTHSSDFHKFTDRAGDGGVVTISNGTLVFDDNSVQSTAYQGFTSVPGSSSATGTTGQMAYDSNYFYICVASNHWKRIAASDF